MRSRSGRATLAGLLAFVHLGMGVPARALDDSVEAPMATPDDVVTELYDLVTFEPGTGPEWDRVRSLFLDEAVIVLRTGRDSTTVFTLDGFVDDFVGFIERAGVAETGFKEAIVRSRSLVYGDLAQVLVLYEAMIPGSPRPPQRGIDNIQLTRRSDGWRIVSITNEIVSPGRPLPAELEQ